MNRSDTTEIRRKRTHRTQRTGGFQHRQHGSGQVAAGCGRRVGTGGKRWVGRWVRPGLSGRAVGKRTGFSHFETALTHLFPHNSMQVVDFPRMCAATVFGEAVKWVVTDETAIKHGCGKDVEQEGTGLAAKEHKERKRWEIPSEGWGRKPAESSSGEWGQTGLGTNVGNPRVIGKVAGPEAGLPGRRRAFWRRFSKPSVRLCSPMFA
jgi:hypothetical protein